MNAFSAIRKRLGMTQSEIAVPLGTTQANVSFYENGQTVPPGVAAKLIEFAKTRKLDLTYDMVYGAAALPPEQAPAAEPSTPKPRSKPTEHAEASRDRRVSQRREGPTNRRGRG